MGADEDPHPRPFPRCERMRQGKGIAKGEKGTIMSLAIQACVFATLLIGDLLAAASVLGSALMLLTSFVNLIAGRRVLTETEQILRWSIVGLIFGTAGLVLLTVTGTRTEQIGVILRLSPAMVGVLLIVSCVLLVIRVMLSSWAARLRKRR